MKLPIYFLTIFLTFSALIFGIYYSTLKEDKARIVISKHELAGLEYLKLINTLALNIVSHKEEALQSDVENIYQIQNRYPEFKSELFNEQMHKFIHSQMHSRDNYEFLAQLNLENYRIGDPSYILFEPDRELYYLGSLLTHYLSEYLVSLYITTGIVQEYTKTSSVSTYDHDIFIEQNNLIYLSSEELHGIVDALSSYDNAIEITKLMQASLQKLKTLSSIEGSSLLTEMSMSELERYLKSSQELIDIALLLEDETTTIFESLLQMRVTRLNDKISLYTALFSMTTIFIGLLLIYFYYLNASSSKKDEELKKNAQRLDDLTVFTKTDVKGSITYVSRGFERISGYSKEQLLGKNHRIFRHHSTTKEFYKEMWEKILNKEQWRGEIKNVAKNGDVYWEELQIVPDLDKRGILQGFTGYRKNITYQKALESQKEETQKALEFKSRFLSNMSHEIRTPLNSIIGMTQLVLKSDLLSKQRDMLNQVNSASSLLLGVINDILDFSKIEVGELKIERTAFNMHTLSSDILSMFASKAKENEIELSVDTTLLSAENYLGDPLRLSQVLTNLVSNAIKFTSKGRVELIIKSMDNEALYFEVKDSGIGLKKESLESLFEEFVQADMSTSRKFGGTGLGLSISKNLVNLMGGNLEVKSVYGEGSSFFFTLDLQILEDVEKAQKEGSQHSEQLEDEVNALEGIKILIAEDNKMNRDLMRMFLEDTKLQLSFADDGEEAIRYAQEGDFDMIFMDIQMPNLNGYDATKMIRENDTKIPIIGLSANVMKEDIEKGLALGMNDYLFKPLDVQKLYQAILMFVQKSKS